MSAICGVVRWDGRPVSHEEVARMTERLRHRGEDAGGVWVDGTAGFGHRLLFTTPESLHERLPLRDSEARLTLTADARIDNRDQLLTSLRISSRPDRPVTDCELIAAAYRRWGTDCAIHLIGDFAFAIWDDKSRTLFCARDPMGVKPFYYHRGPRSFVFGSEIKALWESDQPPVRRLNDSHIADFLQGHFDDRESTFFDGVLRLPAAHTLTINSMGVVAIRRYWDLDAERELILDSDDEYVEAFRAAFDSAVRCRTRSAFRVGSTLSGGLDSSSIAVTARNMLREQRGEALHTFSAVFPGMSEEERRICDESEFIDMVVATGGFDVHRIHADELTPFHDLDRVLWHLDEPHYGYNLYIHRAIYEKAHRVNVRVVLDGVDGDACVSHGLERLAYLVSVGSWNELDVQIDALATTHAARRLDRRFWARHFALPHLDTLVRERRWEQWKVARTVVHERYGVDLRTRHLVAALRPLLPQRVQSAWYRMRGRPQPSDILSPTVLRGATRRHDPTKGGRWSTCRAAHRAWIESPLYQDALEMADKCSAPYGVEPRYPFFDRRLLELCLSLPVDKKLDHGWTRLIMLQAMEGRLPAPVQWRAFKQDLGPNFRNRVRVRARRFTSVDAVRSARIAPYVNASRVRTLARHFDASWFRPALTDIGKTLFRCSVLDAWLEMPRATDVARLMQSRPRSAQRSDTQTRVGEEVIQG
jgi:asparagine synthase (glutamine-hydrolysing)